MMNFVSLVIIALLYLCEQISTKQLRIVHYNNVTISTCGLNAFSAKPTQKRCFKWHQTILELKQSFGNIKDGRYAKKGEFPYTVLLKRHNPFCTGVIINEKWIITAAHCLEQYHSDIQVYTGITDYPIYFWRPKLYSVQTINPKNIYLHANYTLNSTNSIYDIALIKLETKIDLNINKANAVCLPANEFKIEFENELVTVTGWGWLNDTERNFKGLKMTQIKLGDITYNNTLARIWANVSNYGQTCKGDSGGPLVQYVNGRAVLIGISASVVSVDSTYDKPCNILESMAFTAVSYHLNWIIETIRNN